MLSCSICKSKVKPLYSLGNFHYFFCSDCNALFLHPKPSEKVIKQYYKSQFEYTAGKKNENRIRKRARIIITKLKKLNPTGKKLLDVGSGFGYFLDEAKKCDLDVTGIEPSKNLHSISINRLIDTNIIYSSFENFYKRNQGVKFDFISLIHVIEHIPNPKDFIRMASKMLNKNGILYIETPNFDSWLAKVEKENYTFLTPPDHIWIFSIKLLQLIIVACPELYLQSYSSYSYSEHFMGIMKKLVPRHPKGVQDTNLDIDLKLKTENFKFIRKKLTYYLFDKIIAPVCTLFLNIGGYGSILELYIKKK